MKTLLILSPKQIILLLFGLPFVFSFFFMGIRDFINISWIKSFFISVPTILVLSGLLCWIWVIGISTNQKANSKIRMQSYLFKAGFIYTLIYILIFVPIYNSYWAPKMLTDGISSTINTTEYLLSSLCSFVAVLYMFYAIYFIAKNIVMAEEQKEIKFKDFADVFYSFLFLPIGIWVAQSRVQKLFKGEKA